MLCVFMEHLLCSEYGLYRALWLLYLETVFWKAQSRKTEIKAVLSSANSYLPGVQRLYCSFSVTSCFSVAKRCLTLCNPIDGSTPGCLCPPLPPRICSDSCPLSWWCYLIISSSAASFSFFLQSFPASRSFPMSRLFALGGQSIGAPASASVLPMNIQNWFPLGLTSLISLQSKEHWRVFSNTTTVQKHQFFSAQLSLWFNSHIHCISDAIQPSRPLSTPSPTAFNLSQHQDLFHWVSSLHQVTKVLEFQLQHQFFQWIFRTDFL